VPLIRPQGTRDNFEQGRLACSVSSHQTDTLFLSNDKTDVVKEYSVAVLNIQIGCCQHEKSCLKSGKSAPEKKKFQRARVTLLCLWLNPFNLAAKVSRQQK
jgi:hypothetical protein